MEYQDGQMVLNLLNNYDFDLCTIICNHSLFLLNTVYNVTEFNLVYHILAIPPS